jgi:hypothetical protein
VASVSRLEAGGGIERWTSAVEEDATLAGSLAAATSEQRRIRRELAAGSVGQEGGSSLNLGIGGSSRPEKLKCLHAHVAFAMANRGYELGDRIVGEIEPLWPERCCTLG